MRDAPTLITIYALCEPDTFIVRYIGKTQDLRSRLRHHQLEVRKGFHTRKANWLRNLKGREPSVLILAEVKQDQWQEVERYWIKRFREEGFDLTNYADGGQTSPVEGKGHSEETKQKMRSIALADGRRPPTRKGISPSLEARNKQRETNLRLGIKPPNVAGWNKGQRKSHCSSGHEYLPETTRIYSRRGHSYQICRICEKRNLRKYLLKKRGA